MMKKTILFGLFALMVMANTNAQTTVTGTCGNNLTWVLKDSVLTVSGEGAMVDFSFGGSVADSPSANGDHKSSPASTMRNEPPWRNYRESIRKVVLEEGVTCIGTYAWGIFQDNGYPNLREIVFPGSLTSIGAAAFCGCGILELTIPATIQNIDIQAFYYCKNLKTVIIEDSPEVLTSYGCFNMDSPIQTVYLGRNTGSSLNFRSISTLTDVTIGNQVTELHHFTNCTGLTKIAIPSSVTVLGGLGGTGLTEIVIPESVKKINDGGFEGCTGLTEINLPDSIREIGESAFVGCTGLTEIIFPGVDIPLFVSKNAFRNCTSLKKIVMENTIFQIIFWQSAGSVFQNCPVETLYLGRDIECTGGYPFKGMTTLKELIIGERIGYISSNAFAGCNGLNGELVFPKSLSGIGESAFADCSKLEKLTFLGRLNSVGEKAFYNCYGLRQIILQNTINPPQCYSTTFDGVSTPGIYLYIPYGGRDSYSNALVWRDFRIFEDIFLQNNVVGQSAVISWYPVPEADGYTITVYTDEAGTQVFGTYNINIPVSAPQMMSYTIDGLSPNTPYYYTLAAVNTNGTVIVAFNGDFITQASTKIDKVLANDIMIFPNPVENELRVTSSELQAGDIVQIYDISGKLIHNSRFSAHNSINVSSLSRGVYFVKTGNGTKKFVKSK